MSSNETIKEGLNIPLGGVKGKVYSISPLGNPTLTLKTLLTINIMSYNKGRWKYQYTIIDMYDVEYVIEDSSEGEGDSTSKWVTEFIKTIFPEIFYI